MRSSFGGFHKLLAPEPRVVYVGSVFPQFFASVIPLTTGTHLVFLPPLRGVTEVVAATRATEDAVGAASIEFRARIGGVVVGKATLIVNNGSAILMANNSPCLFTLRLSPNLATFGLDCVGTTLGGVTLGGAAATTPGANYVLTTTADVAGPIELDFLAITRASGAFTLNRLHVIEYPEPSEI